MIMYNKQKYIKIKKGKLQKLEFKSNNLNFGVVGLKATEPGILSFKQIESARKTISRKIKRKGKIWVKISFNLPLTSKSNGTRMGKGKGVFKQWGGKVKAGNVLFEICGISLNNAIKSLKTGSMKLPIKTKIFN